MAKRDYYEILGIEKGADERSIKKAYRKLARKHHPDASDESPEVAEKKFKEISNMSGPGNTSSNFRQWENDFAKRVESAIGPSSE